jgi:hypothetical protein
MEYSIQVNGIFWRMGAKWVTMVVGCSLLVKVSVHGGMLTMAGSWWGEKVITPMFNKVLLTKQGWRLMQNPDSLIAQVLRAKYFPHDSFLSSMVGTHPSFVWRSLLSAIELLKESLVWRVSDGKSIHIWNDRWLPTLAVQSPPRVILQTRQFQFLLIQSYEYGILALSMLFSVWKRQRSLLLFLWVLLFLRIELCGKAQRIDFFSVRSAYHMGMEINACSMGGTS